MLPRGAVRVRTTEAALAEAGKQSRASLVLRLCLGGIADVINDRNLLRCGEFIEALLIAAEAFRIEPSQTAAYNFAVIAIVTIRRAAPFIDEGWHTHLTGSRSIGVLGKNDVR